MESVFSTTELLEAALLHVDMTTLLVSCLRVSRTWNRVIAHSPALQRALYFQPVPQNQQPDQEAEVAEWIRNFELNPLLVEKFGPLFFDFVSDGPEYEDREERHGYVRRANSFYALPWTPSACKEYDVHDPRPNVNQVLRYSTTPPGIAESDAEAISRERTLRRRFTRRSASWRRMLVSQPPPSRLGFLWEDSLENLPYVETARSVSVAILDCELQTENGRSLDRSGEDVFSVGSGLRMGRLYDLLQHRAGHHETPSVWFRVLWGRLREPFFSDHFRDTCRDVLSKAGVVVEFICTDDYGWSNCFRDPPDTVAFDRVFRCDDHQLLEFETEVIRGEPQIPSYPLEAQVLPT